MRGLGGFVLLAGIGVGLFVYFPAPVDRDTTLEQAKRATFERVAARSETAIAPVAATAPPSVARFSPGLTLSPVRSNTQLAAAAPNATAPTAKVESVANWQTSIAPAPAGSSAALEPTDPESRYKLVVDIQQQLKRVGCYWGRANGAWNNSTRDAIRTFTLNTNAALPVDKPDYLLLSLLKQNSGRSCGNPETTTVATRPQKPDAVAAAQPEVLPWKANPAQQANSLYKPMPNSVVSSEPLPGRMTIGGPKEFPAAQQAPLIPGTAPGAAPGQPNAATAALEQGASPPPPAYVAPRAAAPKPRQAYRKVRRNGPGTPRYNLMLSLGGVY
jgi:hypothetical protein